MDSPGPSASARSLARERHKIHGVTKAPACPGWSWLCLLSSVINNTVPFSLLGLDNQLYGHVLRGKQNGDWPGEYTVVL